MGWLFMYSTKDLGWNFEVSGYQIGLLSPCNSNCDVLDVVEIQGSSLSRVLQWLRGKRLVVSVYKAAVFGQHLCRNRGILLELREYVRVL